MSGTFTSRDGLDFFCTAWPAPGTARGSVVIVHGYAEHCLRYAHVAAAFNALGFDVYGYDHRGHGQSPGTRGYVERFDRLLSDLDACLEHLWPQVSGGPLFLFGHSMGALVTVRHRQTRPQIPVRGVVYSSGFLALPPDVPPMLLRVAGVLSAVAPWLPVRKLDAKAISKDKTVVKAYEEDPHNYHGLIKARTGAELNAAVIAAQAAFGALRDPMYVFHGTADRLAPVDGSKALHAAAGAADKTLKIYEGGYHELFNDAPREMVLAGVGQWLTAHA